MHDTLTPNVLKSEFSRKIIQIKSLIALGKNLTRKNPEKTYKLVLITPSGIITGNYCELFCSDEINSEQKNCSLDISKVDELANKVLIDAEDELINIKLVDNAEFIKLTDATIESLSSSKVTEFSQLLIYADQITAFSLIEI